eukprot:6491598-Prymnesium_polylepis.1
MPGGTARTTTGGAARRVARQWRVGGGLHGDDRRGETASMARRAVAAGVNEFTGVDRQRVGSSH